MPSAQVLDRHAGVGLAQEADDLLFGKALLHVQSPGLVGLDSRSGCYSKAGGVALSATNFLKSSTLISLSLVSHIQTAENTTSKVVEAITTLRIIFMASSVSRRRSADTATMRALEKAGPNGARPVISSHSEARRLLYGQRTTRVD